tara:strand:- start:94 stop:711 length:618 start_codon:yes stop_codon:yes gene_type:complete
MAATLLGSDMSGAQEQDSQTQTNATLPLEAEDAAQSGGETGETEIRFVAHEVVQELPTPTEAPDQGAATLRELVDTLPDNAALSPDLMCLAQAVYFESRGEPLSGQLAVAEVIVNRADSPRFPDDYCGVVTQRAQFSFVKGGHIPQPRTSTLAWTRAKAIARIAHRELWETEASDALFFHATHVSPRWARTKIARATIDRHVFYR